MAVKKVERIDYKRFGTFLEDIFRLGLEKEGVCCHFAESFTEGGGKLRIEVVVGFLPELPLVERYIKSQFIVDEKQSKTLRDHDGISPLEYRVRLGPSRSKLPEWGSFEKEPFSVIVEAAVTGALRRALGSLPKGALGDDSPQKGRLISMAARIEDALARLYLREDLSLSLSLSLSEKPDFEDEAVIEPTATKKGAKVEPSSEKMLEVEDPPAVHEEKLPEAGPLDEAVLFFFCSNPRVLERLQSVALENGIELENFEPEKAHCGSGGFKNLVSFLKEQGLSDVEQVSAFLTNLLGSWESLYEAVEIARIRGELPSDETTVFDFALILLTARNSPGLNA